MKKAFLLVALIAVLLVPSASFGQAPRHAPQKISFDFIDADVRNVLRVLAEVSKKNIVIAEDVKGKVTIKLDNVTYDEAFDIILKNNDLMKTEEENVIRVVTAARFSTERERSAKERLDFIREREAKQRLEEEFVTETVFVNYADPVDVEKMIRGDTSSVARATTTTGATTATGAPAPARNQQAQPTVVEKPQGLLSPNGVITLVKWNKALVIKDTRQNVANIVKLIKEHDIPPKQVQIEARIVQANTSFSKELGIQWNASYSNRVRERNVDSSAAITLPRSSTSGGSLGILVGGVADSLQLDLTLSALEGQGKGKIISNPKVITSENRLARITQGTQIPYQTSSQSLGTNIEFKDAVLELEVTPYVVRDGNIRLTIRAKKDAVNFDSRFPVPGIDKREAVTELLVKDGETTVLGGIYETNETDNNSGVPGLSKIPLLGWLFRNHSRTDTKQELLIFITPTILKDLYTEKREL
jgi:type IV pilus assembly protein PilQ